MSAGLDILAKLTKKVNKDQKDVICLFGPPGGGKSSLAAEFPNPQFVTDGRDKGYSDLVRAGLVSDTFAPIEAGDWDSLVAVTKALADPTTPLDCETLVFENLGGFQLHLSDKLIDDEVAKTGKSRSFVSEKFFSWAGQGYKSGTSDFSQWFRTACSITERTNNAGKPMRVIFIGHTALVKDKNIAGLPGEEFYRVDIDLHYEFQKIVHRDCGHIGWLRQKPVVVKPEDGKGIGRALSNDIREIVFHPSAHATAKNRWGLGPEPISMGSSSKHAYANLVNAIVAAKKSRAASTGESK